MLLEECRERGIDERERVPGSDRRTKWQNRQHARREPIPRRRRTHELDRRWAAEPCRSVHHLGRNIGVPAHHLMHALRDQQVAVGLERGLHFSKRLHLLAKPRGIFAEHAGNATGKQGVERREAMADVARVRPLRTEGLFFAERPNAVGPCHDPLDPSADDLEDVEAKSHIFCHLNGEPHAGRAQLHLPDVTAVGRKLVLRREVLVAQNNAGHRLRVRGRMKTPRTIGTWRAAERTVEPAIGADAVAGTAALRMLVKPPPRDPGHPWVDAMSLQCRASPSERAPALRGVP